MRSLVLLIFFGLSCHLAPAQLSAKEARIVASLQRELTGDLQKDSLHTSVSAAVVDKGRLVWANAFGFTGPDRAVPADTGTIYKVASITKMFTVTLLMQLVEEGKVRLNDPAERYVPEVSTIPGYGKGMKFTLQELASHTAGLDREPEGVTGASFGSVDQWEDKLLAVLPYASVNSTPGMEFKYSNVGFAILGLALERAAGEPFVRLIQERIFTPLHMDNSFFVVPPEKRDQLAPGVDTRNGRINTRTALRQEDGEGYRVPSGGIWSTPIDLAHFEIALMHGVLIKEESLRIMVRPSNASRNYGMAMMIMRDKYLTMIGHNGLDPGYTSQLSIDPYTGNAVILLRNTRPGITDLVSATRDVLSRL
jgi:CubicO group peptidase (beta-lactamase class C family)